MFNVQSSMIVKTRAVVLHTLKYGERKVIVELLCRDTGRTACIVAVPKTQKGRVQMQMLQPMTLLDVEIDVRPTVQLQRLRDVRMSSPFSTIPFMPEKLSIVLFIAEFLYHATRGEQRNEAAISLIFAMLCSLTGRRLIQITFLLPMQNGCTSWYAWTTTPCDSSVCHMMTVTVSPMASSVTTACMSTVSPNFVPLPC